jgi:hypothetical protein
MLAGKGWSHRKNSRVTSAARRQTSLSEHDSSHANQETGAAGKKARKNHFVVDARGRRVVTIVAIARLDPFQAKPIWKMSGWIVVGGSLMHKSILASLLAAAVALPATPLMATVILPTGLTPGSQYQLIFVTADTHDAVNPSVGAYNPFAASEAAIGVPFGLPSGLTWNAVVSTVSVSANSNAPSFAGIPVYDTHGDLVAFSSTSAGLYLLPLSHAPDFTQRGDFLQTNVWTGGAATSPALPPTPQPIGTPFSFDLTKTVEAFGLSTEVGFRWLYADNSTDYSGPPGVTTSPVLDSIYALSTPITVPAPEPATITLMGSALLLMGGHRFLRWRRKR